MEPEPDPEEPGLAEVATVISLGLVRRYGPLLLIVGAVAVYFGLVTGVFWS